jgi:DNA-binding HxlR family transcriptional regulator
MSSRAQVDPEDLKLATSVIRGRWKTMILFHLARSPLRFGALRRAVAGISEKVLIEHLRQLESDRIVSRSVEATVPPHVEYAMTPHGRSLCKVIEALAAWGGSHRRYLETTRASAPRARGSSAGKAPSGRDDL